MALLHLEGVGLLGYNLHRVGKEVASTLIPSRVPSLHDFPLLLA